MTKPTEAELVAKGLTAPRVTPERIAHVIVGEHFHVPPGTTLTLCVLTLRNGFTVTGESACASPENFDREIGERFAREDAKRKIWALEGYALRERLAGAALVPAFLASLQFDTLNGMDTTREERLDAWNDYLRAQSPEVTIEASRVVSTTAKERANEEFAQLEARLEGLTRFQGPDGYRNMPFAIQTLMDTQRMHMIGYRDALRDRIANWVE